MAPAPVVAARPEAPPPEPPRPAAPAPSETPKPAAPPDTITCGYTPEPSGSFPTDRVAFAGGGCSLAPAGPEPWRSIKEVTVVELRFEPNRMTMAVVFLDEQKRRVLPVGRPLRYDVAMRTRQRGRVVVPETHRDGVFEFVLPPNERPSKACTLSIHVTFDTGAGQVEDWVDDWLFSC